MRTPLQTPIDFLTVIRRNMHLYRNRRSFTFVSEVRAPGRTYQQDVLGFADLDHQARVLADRLDTLGLRDRAVLLLYPEGLNFVTAFLSCLYARVIAVPAPLPELDAGRSTRTQQIITDADISLILTDTTHQGMLQTWLSNLGLTETVRCLVR